MDRQDILKPFGAVTEACAWGSPPDQIVVGEVVRKMEPDFAVVEFSLNKEKTTMANYDYLIIGGGMTSAVESAKSIQPRRCELGKGPIDSSRRSLVERLWPRGMKKEALHMDAWCKNLAPSGDLRRWFNHDPAKWKEFQQQYRIELADNPAACQPLLDAAKQGNITLLYSAHDTEHNNAVALKSYLEERLRGKKSRRR